MSEKNRELFGTSLKRREFIKTSALLGTGAVAAAQFPWLIDSIGGNGRREIKPTAEYTLARPENIVYSLCRQCNVFCPIKGKIKDGVLVKIDGNPYSAQTFIPHLDYDTPPTEAATVDGRLCPKGLTGIQLLYDPYRLRKVLKRVGPRGSGKWQTIDFDTAIDEIVNGGDLFGEGSVQGLKDIFVLRDPDVAKEMADDVKAIEKGKMTVAEFKEKHAANLDVLIDPDHPDLGPKNNQFVMEAGRTESARKGFFGRFVKNAFGSVNLFAAGGGVCTASSYKARIEMTNQYKEKDGKWKWSGGKKKWSPEALNTEFILAFGINYFEARGLNPMTARITDGLVDRALKIAVVDPRLSKLAAKAWKWVPVKPGMEGALALGMIRWIIDSERFDGRYLANANQAAADADGEPTYSNATWLVKIEDDGPGKLLRAEDVGLGGEHEFVTMKDGEPTAVDPNGDEPVEGELFYSGNVQGIEVKSSLELLKEEAFSRSVEEWAEIAGIKTEDIEELADEFTSHGKKAGVPLYRGMTTHTNAFYNTMAAFSLNLLIGNIGWKGGLSQGGGSYSEKGDKEGQPFEVGKLHPGKHKAFGIMMTRQGSKYEKSTLFEGYPARRPWVPIPGGALRQELYPSMGEGYPYSAKALFMYMTNTVHAGPGGQMVIDALSDPSKIPLVFASDIVIGDQSRYADYLFPDISIWERWGFHGGIDEVPTKQMAVRQPMVAPIPETVTVFGEEMPISAEAISLAIAERLGLSGFGEGGLGESGDYKRPEDLYLKQAANVAAGNKPGTEVPDADDAEVALFEEARRHLPPSVFDPVKWKAAVGDKWWRKVVYVINRGGRFEAFEKGWDGDYQGHKYSGVVSFYLETVASKRNSMTGEKFSGIAKYEPIKDLLGNEVNDADFGFNMITYKEAFMAQSRSISGYWLLGARPENTVLVNKRDADDMGLKEGAKVRLESASNPGVVDLGNGQKFDLVAKVKIVEGVRPGVVAVAHGYGHWGYGARDCEIDGEKIAGDERREKGIQPNLLARLDANVPNACLIEPIAGNGSFNDTKVNLVKV